MTTNDLPRVFVFCNGCSPKWHQFQALSQDDVFLAGHICSDHGFAAHDMGVNEDGWKRDIYAAHYPDGFVVECVDRPLEHEGVKAAYREHTTMGEEEHERRCERLRAFWAAKKENHDAD